jgi:hypothetical protein
MAQGSFADGRRIRAVLVGSGLAGLLGATACAVASVSLWLVPAYLLLVVAILATPRGPRGSSWPGKRAKTGGIGIAESGQGSGAGQAEGLGQLEPSLDAGSYPADSADESDESEPRSLRVDPGAAAVARPRKSRARSRKASKSAAEPAPDSAPITWVRVGPGKYLRSDSLTQVGEDEVGKVMDESDQSLHPSSFTPHPSEESTFLVEDRPAEVAPPADAPASEEPAPVAHPETGVDVAAILPTPEADMAEPLSTAGEPAPEPTAPEAITDAEEYGIAPSAFGPLTSEPLPAESREPVVLEPIEPIPAELECDLGLTADLGVNAPMSAQADARPAGRRPRSRTFTRYVPRRIANAFTAAKPRAMPSRHGARGPSRPRAVVRCSSARESRRADAARRASGRTSHVRRDWRARSPPPVSWIVDGGWWMGGRARLSRAMGRKPRPSTSHQPPTKKHR